MMQKIRNRLPKLFQKTEKEKSSRTCDFDLANTFILLLSQKMQHLALSKKILEQQRHAYYFKNRRHTRDMKVNDRNYLQQCVGDRQLTGGHNFEKGFSQRASLVSLPPIPHTVNYSWLFDNEDNYKLNCFERAKIRDQCRQLTLDQSVLAYEIFLKRSERIIEPMDLPKVLDEILTVLLSRKPVRKNCIEVFKKRMEMAAPEPSEHSQSTQGSFSPRMLASKVRLARAFRPIDELKPNTLHNISLPVVRQNSKMNVKDSLQDQESELGSQTSNSQIMSAIDKVRVVYVQSKDECPTIGNICSVPRRFQYENKQNGLNDGNLRSPSLVPVEKQSNNELKQPNDELRFKDRRRKVGRSQVRSDLSSSTISECLSSRLV